MTDFNNYKLFKNVGIRSSDNKLIVMNVNKSNNVSFYSSDGGTNNIDVMSINSIINKSQNEDLNLSSLTGTTINPVITINNNHGDCRITTNLNVAGNVNITKNLSVSNTIVNHNLIIPTHTSTESSLLSNVQGSIYFNTTENMYEGYVGDSEGWQPLGGFSKTKDATIHKNLNVLQNINCTDKITSNINLVKHNLIIPTHTSTESSLLSNVQGSIYFNTSEKMYEGYVGDSEGWQPLGGFSKTKDATIHKNLNVNGNINLTNGGIIKTTGIGSFGSINCGTIDNVTIGGTGTWNGSTISYNYGGTGLSSLIANKILQVNNSANGYQLIDLPTEITDNNQLTNGENFITASSIDTLTNKTISYNQISEIPSIPSYIRLGDITNGGHSYGLICDPNYTINYANAYLKYHTNGTDLRLNCRSGSSSNIFFDYGNTNVFKFTSGGVIQVGSNKIQNNSSKGWEFVGTDNRQISIPIGTYYPYIGASSSYAYLLHINSIGDAYRISGTTTSNLTHQFVYGKVGIGRTPSYQLDVNGTARIGSSTYSSDDRIKIDEELILEATDILLRLRPQKYKKYMGSNLEEVRRHIINNKKEDYIIESGLIAQEMFYETPELRFLVNNTIDPNIVDETPRNFSDIKNDPDYSNWSDEISSVNYTGLIPYLIQGFKEQQTIINTQQNEINTLKTENQQQQTIINTQQNEINTLKTENQQQQTKINELTSIIDKLKTANSFEEFKQTL
jgi:hypothetical protein